jgi:hypothetical protein
VEYHVWINQSDRVIFHGELSGKHDRGNLAGEGKTLKNHLKIPVDTNRSFELSIRSSPTPLLFEPFGSRNSFLKIEQPAMSPDGDDSFAIRQDRSLFAPPS